MLSVFAIVSAIGTSFLFAHDLSSISADLSTVSSGETKAFLVVSDPSGRRIGGNITLGTDAEFNEIPTGACSVEVLDDNDNGNPGPESVQCSISAVSVGTYTFTLYGRETVRYRMYLSGTDNYGDYVSNPNIVLGYIVNGATLTYSVAYDPGSMQGITSVTKSVSYSSLRQDIESALSLSQLGDEKFAASLIKNIDLVEKLAGVCKRRKAPSFKDCEPAADVLELFVKRLETANRKCDSGNPQQCDEDKDWDDFGKEHRKDHDYDEFFRDWGRDDWSKDKKTCKRFVANEALKIIKEDAQWLIKSLGGDTDKDHEKEDSNKRNNHNGAEDNKDKR